MDVSQRHLEASGTGRESARVSKASRPVLVMRGEVGRACNEERESVGKEARRKGQKERA